MEMYMHTDKAVAHGHPEDRVFLVVNPGRVNKLAWKCRLNKDGTLYHPAFENPLKLTKEDIQRGLIMKGENGSEPTAVFKKDSFYRAVTLEQLAK